MACFRFGDSSYLVLLDRNAKKSSLQRHKKLNNPTIKRESVIQKTHSP